MARDLVEKEDNDDDPPDVSKVVLNIQVLQAGGGVLFAVASTLGEVTEGFHERHDGRLKRVVEVRVCRIVLVLWEMLARRRVLRV